MGPKLVELADLLRVQMSKDQARTRTILLLAILIGLVVGVVVLFSWAMRINNATVAIIPTLYVIPSDTPTTSVTLTPTTTLSATSQSTTLATTSPTNLPTNTVVTETTSTPLPSN